MMKFENMTDDQLMKDYKETHNMIFNIECYGMSDFAFLFALEKELKRRPIRIDHNESIVFSREGK